LTPMQRVSLHSCPRIPWTLLIATVDRTYMRQGQLTPVSSSSGSRSISPKTPDARPGAGRGEDYFAPKIANEYDSTPPQSRRPGGYSGLNGPDGFDGQMYPANSPKKLGPSLLQRMNTIAPGPFEMNRRQGASARNAFARSNADDNLNDSSSSRGGFVDRPGTSASNNSFTSAGSNNNNNNNNNNTGSAVPPRLPRKNGYGGFGPPQGDQNDFEPAPFSAANRSGTFPRPSDPTEAPMRTPSAPGPRPDRSRRPSNVSMGRRPSFGPDTSRPPPPRKSLIRPSTAGNGSTVNLASEFGIGNPYHTPSESMSSSISAYSSQPSQPSQPSSRTSPERSRSRSGRERTDTSGFDSLMNDLQSSMDELKPKDLPPMPRQPPPFDKEPGSLRTRDRRAAPPSELRIDPSVQGRSGRQRSPLATPQYDVPREMDRRFNERGNRWTESSPQRSLSPPQNRRRDGSAPPPRRFCKSCGEGITGKSISSADGRLTGRYHKACFVCTTCSEPFSSAEFYVLNDKPYCELHYHKLNGSLCGACGRGIEGQYLEDETFTKYHVGCFRCADCGMSLSNGYFEVDGKAYCERDAWRLVQQPYTPGPNNSGAAGTEVDLMNTYALPPRTPGRTTPSPLGLPGRPASRKGSISSITGGRPPMPVGLPRGEKLAPGMGPTPRPRMNKRMTRLGMM
jgi:LIM domain